MYPDLALSLGSCQGRSHWEKCCLFKRRMMLGYCIHNFFWSSKLQMHRVCCWFPPSGLYSVIRLLRQHFKQSEQVALFNHLHLGFNHTLLLICDKKINFSHHKILRKLLLLSITYPVINKHWNNDILMRSYLFSNENLNNVFKLTLYQYCRGLISERIRNRRKLLKPKINPKRSSNLRCST